MKNTSAALPEGWSEATLGDLLIRIVGGGTPPRNVAAYFEGTTPWFTVKDMKSPRAEDAQEHISDEAIRCSATNLIEPDTLVIATRIALGKAIMQTVRCTINQDLKALYFGGDVSPKFMLYWVMASEQLIQSRGSGTTVMGIRLEHVKEFSLAVPPANEQTRIVEKLEELLSDLDAGVAELKAAQRKLAQYRQSLLKAAVEGALTADWRDARASTAAPQETGAELLQRILTERRARWEAKQLAKYAEQGKSPPKGWQDKYKEPVAPDTTDLPALPEAWVWATIDQIAEVGTGVTPLRSKQHYFEGGTIPWVTSGALNDEIVTASNEHVTPLAQAECRLEIYPAGSLLVAMYGEGKTRGKCAELVFPATINQAIAALVLGGESASISGHLKTFLLDAYEAMRKQASGGVQPNLNLQIIKSLTLPLPPLDEQTEIQVRLSDQLSAHDAHRLAIGHGLKQSAAQRKNILKSAFAGQLVPQDANDEPASALLQRIRSERGAGDNGGKKVGRKHMESA